MATSASRQPTGPAPQLTPRTSTSTRSASAAAAAAGVVPSGSAASSPNVRSATIGRSAASERASSTASARCSTTPNVSNQKTSTPPSRRPSIVSRNAARTSASARWVLARRRPERPDRSGDERITTGDVTGFAGELGAAAGQPSGTIGETVRGEADTVGAERRGLDEVGSGGQVLAVDRPDRSAPVEWRRLVDGAARCGTPRLNSSVPIAPSARSGPRDSRAWNRARASPEVGVSVMPDPPGSGRASVRRPPAAPFRRA